MALISAMPPAAALPSRYPLGIVQNRLRMLKMAIEEMSRQDVFCCFHSPPAASL
jgi:hypothetical protein